MTMIGSCRSRAGWGPDIDTNEEKCKQEKVIIIEKRAGEEDYGTVKYVSGKYSRKRPAAARTNAAERDESEKKKV